MDRGLLLFLLGVPLRIVVIFFFCGIPYSRGRISFLFPEPVGPDRVVSVNWRTPHTPPRERRLVPRAARVHANGRPFFLSSRQRLKQKRDRHVGFVDRAEHSTVRAMRGPGAKAWATPWSFVLTLCLSGQKKETAACGWATASPPHSQAPTTGSAVLEAASHQPDKPGYWP